MDALLLGTKGYIAGGDLPLGSHGYLVGAYGFLVTAYRSILNLISRMTMLFDLRSRI